MHSITVPAAVAEPLLAAGNHRVIAVLNATTTLHAALVRRKTGGYYIRLGLPVLKKAGCKKGDSITLSLAADTSNYQFAMPEELAAVLETDPDADRIFHALSPGKQRGLIHLVALVKSTDKKIERALKIAAKLKAGIVSPALVLK